MITGWIYSKYRLIRSCTWSIETIRMIMNTLNFPCGWWKYRAGIKLTAWPTCCVHVAKPRSSCSVDQCTYFRDLKMSDHLQIIYYKAERSILLLIVCIGHTLVRSFIPKSNFQNERKISLKMLISGPNLAHIISSIQLMQLNNYFNCKHLT